MSNINPPMLRLLGRNPGWSISDLSGDIRESTRRTIMYELLGVKLPAAKCGYNAVVSAMVSASGIDSDCCKAELYQRLLDWCRNIPDTETKVMGWAQPTSEYAQSLGFGSSGTWYVGTLPVGSDRPTFLAAYGKSKANARKHFESMDLPPHSLVFELYIA